MRLGAARATLADFVGIQALWCGYKVRQDQLLLLLPADFLVGCKQHSDP